MPLTITDRFRGIASGELSAGALGKVNLSDRQGPRPVAASTWAGWEVGVTLVTSKPTSGSQSSLAPAPVLPRSETKKAASAMEPEEPTERDGAEGRLNAAIANELGKLMADFIGRGATRSRAFLGPDVVVCLLEDGATRGEENLATAGRADLVRQGRDVLQRAMEEQLVAVVERLTGRTVRLFLSGSSTLGESSVEVFVLDPLPADSVAPT